MILKEEGGFGNLPTRSSKKKRTSPREQIPPQHQSALQPAVRFLSLSFGTFFTFSINRAPSLLLVEFTQLLHLFHRYLGIVTGENDASSCLGLAEADKLPLCWNFSVKNPALYQHEQQSGGEVYREPIKHRWCHFSWTITLCNTHLFQNDSEKSLLLFT